MTIEEARKKLNDNNLSDQQIGDILVMLRKLCERVVDKTIKEKYGKS